MVERVNNLDFVAVFRNAAAGFIVGKVKRKNIIDGSNVRKGDVVIGLSSNGLHTNGYSLAIKVLLTKLKLEDSPFDKKDFHTAFYPLDLLTGTVPQSSLPSGPEVIFLKPPEDSPTT